ncbi:MAG: ATP-binding protein [Clostridiaceae bacterium]
MKKRIITSSMIFLLSILIFSVLVLSSYYGREAQAEAKQNLKTAVELLADSTRTTAQAVVLSTQEMKRSILYVLDASGNSQGPILPPDLKSSEAFKASLDNDTGTAQVMIAGKQFISASAQLEDGGWLIGVSQLAPMKGYLDVVGQNLLLILAILFAGGIVVVFYLTNYILEPLHEFTRTTAQLAAGDLSSKVKLNKHSEFEGLVENFNLLMDQMDTMRIDSLGSQSQLESILGSMNSGVIAVDNNNKIIIFNPFARKLFGIFTETMGKDISEVIKDDDLLKMMIVADQFQELVLKRNSNTVVRYKTTELLTDRSLKRGKVTVIQDVTDLKTLEQMRSQFVANVSHELRTPLTSIKGFSETLRDVEDPTTKNKFLDIIEAEADRLNRLIEDILTLSSIENQEVQIADIIDLTNATKNSMGLLEVQAKAKNIELSLIVKGEPEIIGDADMYQQMILNLVENAIKYTRANGRVKVRLEEWFDSIILKVEDTGIGIPTEHLPRLFERFYRVDKARHRAEGGTGLGLAIVKHIVITFGGTIQVESEPGKGSIFTITLPAHFKDGRKPGNRFETIKFNE